MTIARELGLRMCAAWGINPNECTAIDVRWRPNELPTALVELTLNEQVAHELLVLSVVGRDDADEAQPC